MNPLALLSAYKWLAIGAAFAGLLALLGVQTVRLAEAKTDTAKERQERLADVAKAQVAATQQIASYRAEEARRHVAQQQEIYRAHAQTIAAAADAASAAGAAVGLRQRAAALAAAPRRPAACNPSAAAGGPPTDPAADLLADVLGSVIERAERLAAYADSARIAGEACQASYGALTP